MRQTFEIPGRLIGLNEYVDMCRRNRYGAAKAKRENQHLVCLAIKKHKMLRFKNKVSIQFVWIEPNMKRDKDNISFAKKFILDALVEMQIIPNDNWKWINNLSDKFAVNRKNPRIVVTLDDEM